MVILPFKGIPFILGQFNPLKETILVVVKLVPGCTLTFPNLSEIETAKAASYFRNEDIENYKWRHHLLNSWMSNFSGIPVEHLKYTKSKEGKPTLNESGVHFNISHSSNLFAIAFGPHPLGVDIESHRESTPFQEVAEQHFHPLEKQFIEQDKTNENAFFSIWTRKEALLKAIGSGLTDELYMIDTTAEYFSHPPNRYRLNTYQGEQFTVSIAQPENHKINSQLCTFEISKL